MIFMKKCCKKSCLKKSCGCNQSNCVSSNNVTNECVQYKQSANDKCQQAECLSNKANKIAQEAIAAEKRAECLKQQAIEECMRANELWDRYNQLADEGICLMQQAQACLAKSVECYENLYEDVEGCDLDDFGYDSASTSPTSNNWGCKGNCNCGCGCN